MSTPWHLGIVLSYSPVWSYCKFYNIWGNICQAFTSSFWGLFVKSVLWVSTSLFNETSLHCVHPVSFSTKLDQFLVLGESYMYQSLSVVWRSWWASETRVDCVSTNAYRNNNWYHQPLLVDIRTGLTSTWHRSSIPIPNRGSSI